MEEEKKGSLLKVGLIESVIIVILIVVIIGILGYLKIIPINKFIPNFSASKSSSQTDTNQGKPTAVGIACPVDTPKCKAAVMTKYNNNSAALFNVADNHNVYAVGNLLGSSTDTANIGKDKATIIKTPFIFKDKCYTATYVTHYSATVNQITQIPYPKGTPVIRVTDDKLTLGESKFSVLVQLQEKELDPNKSKPATQRCTAASPNDSSANYVDLSTSSFN